MKGRGVIEWAVEHFKAVMAALVGGSIALIIGIFIVNSVKDYSPSITLLDLNLAPLNSKITLDGNTVSQGTNEVTAGTHHLAFSAAGFESKEYDIDVKANETNSITDYLLNAENGLKYYESNDAEMDVLRASSDEEAKEYAAAFDRKYKIRTDTPFELEYGDIGTYGIANVEFGEGTDKCQTRLCLIVGTYETEDSRSALIQALLNLGYRYADYEVVYEGN